jgi:hypothetical protein
MMRLQEENRNRKIKMEFILAAESKAKMRRFLLDLANLPNDQAKAEAFRGNYGQHFFGLPMPNLSDLPAAQIQRDRLKAGLKLVPVSELPDMHVVGQRWNKQFHQCVFALRNCLQGIFRAPGHREKEWLLDCFKFLIKDLSQPAHSTFTWETFAASTQSSIQLPRESYLEKVASYLTSLLPHLRYCPNRECPRPFYIARHGNQKYCSRKCATPFRLAANRKWWEQHGPQWRKERSRRKKSKRREKRK